MLLRYAHSGLTFIKEDKAVISLKSLLFPKYLFEGLPKLPTLSNSLTSPGESRLMQQLKSLTRPSASSPSVSPTASPVVVYECDVHLKFRMIEEKDLPTDREELLELLLDAFGYGGDEYLEPLQVAVNVAEVPEVEASPEMRRQLIRLRNLKDLV